MLESRATAGARQFRESRGCTVDAVFLFEVRGSFRTAEATAWFSLHWCVPLATAGNVQRWRGLALIFRPCRAPALSVFRANNVDHPPNRKPLPAYSLKPVPQPIGTGRFL